MRSAKSANPLQSHGAEDEAPFVFNDDSFSVLRCVITVSHAEPVLSSRLNKTEPMDSVSAGLLWGVCAEQPNEEAGFALHKDCSIRTRQAESGSLAHKSRHSFSTFRPRHTFLFQLSLLTPRFCCRLICDRMPGFSFSVEGRKQGDGSRYILKMLVWD